MHCDASVPLLCCPPSLQYYTAPLGQACQFSVCISVAAYAAAVAQFMELLEGNRVLEHILMRNKVLDGDNHVLHVQVRWACAQNPKFTWL